MHHLWAEALAPLYAVGDTATKTPDSSTTLKMSGTFMAPRIYAQGKSIFVEGNLLNATSVTLVSATGQLISQKALSKNYGQVQFENIPTGQYIVIIRGKNAVQTSTVRAK